MAKEINRSNFKKSDTYKINVGEGLTLGYFRSFVVDDSDQVIMSVEGVKDRGDHSSHHYIDTAIDTLIEAITPELNADLPSSAFFYDSRLRSDNLLESSIIKRLGQKEIFTTREGAFYLYSDTRGFQRGLIVNNAVYASYRVVEMGKGTYVVDIIKSFDVRLKTILLSKPSIINPYCGVDPEARLIEIFSRSLNTEVKYNILKEYKEDLSWRRTEMKSIPSLLRATGACVDTGQIDYLQSLVLKGEL